MFCHLFEASTFTKNGFDFFRPKHTIQVKVVDGSVVGSIVAPSKHGGVGSSMGGMNSHGPLSPGQSNAQARFIPAKPPLTIQMVAGGAPTLRLPPSHHGGDASTNEGSHLSMAGAPTATGRDIEPSSARGPPPLLPPPVPASPDTSSAAATGVASAIFSSSSSPLATTSEGMARSPPKSHPSSVAWSAVPILTTTPAGLNNESTALIAASVGVDEQTVTTALQAEADYKVRQSEQAVALRVSREMAKWWSDIRVKQFGWRYLFTFPSPINEAEVCLHNFCLMFLVPAHLLLARFYDTPVIGWYIFAGFLLRTIAGPRFDPQAHFVLYILRPILVNRWRLWGTRWHPGPPRQFAQVTLILFEGIKPYDC
jgi:hypothetical protein